MATILQRGFDSGGLAIALTGVTAGSTLIVLMGSDDGTMVIESDVDGNFTKDYSVGSLTAHSTITDLYAFRLSNVSAGSHTIDKVSGGTEWEAIWFEVSGLDNNAAEGTATDSVTSTTTHTTGDVTSSGGFAAFMSVFSAGTTKTLASPFTVKDLDAARELGSGAVVTSSTFDGDWTGNVSVNSDSIIACWADAGGGGGTPIAAIKRYHDMINAA